MHNTGVKDFFVVWNFNMKRVFMLRKFILARDFINKIFSPCQVL